MLTITNANGHRFNVRVIHKGDAWGRDGCLTHDEPGPMVEFYDATLADKPGFGPMGQIITQYRCLTLANVGGGLCLDGGVPVWTVDAAAMRPVVWLCRELTRAMGLR